MQRCKEALTQLPVGFSEFPVEEALQVLVENRVIDSTFYFECMRKQEELSRWIADE